MSNKVSRKELRGEKLDDDCKKAKTLTNEYWRSLGEGYQNVATKDGFSMAYQAAANEDDQLGQLSIAETLISQGYNGLLVSPQTDANLEPAYEKAKAKGIPQGERMSV